MSKHIIEFDLKFKQDADDLKSIMQAREMKMAFIEFSDQMKELQQNGSRPESWSDVIKLFYNIMLDNNVSIND